MGSIENIKEKMKKLESLIALTKEKKSTYNFLLNNELSLIKKLLDQAIPLISNSNNKLKNGVFMVESKRIDQGRLDEIEEELKKIKTTIIPNLEQGIKSIIGDLDRDLKGLQTNYGNLKRISIIT